MVKLNPPNRWSTWDWLKSNLARAPVGKNVCQVESGSSKCMFQHVKTRPGTLGQVATGCVCLLVCIYAIYYILYTSYIYILYIYILYIYTLYIYILYIYTIYILYIYTIIILQVLFKRQIHSPPLTSSHDRSASVGRETAGWLQLCIRKTPEGCIKILQNSIWTCSPDIQASIYQRCNYPWLYNVTAYDSITSRVEALKALKVPKVGGPVWGENWTASCASWTSGQGWARCHTICWW